MGLADEVESRLERVVEGLFSKAFRSKIQPAEIGRRLLREQEGGKQVNVDAVYVPNRYVVLLAPEDHERFEGLIPKLRQSYIDLLKDNARQRRWRFPGTIEVALQAEEAQDKGRFTIYALHEVTQEAPAGERRPLIKTESQDLGGSWRLDQDSALIGRAEDSDIQIADQSVSRRHAQIVKRGDEWWVTDLGSTNHTFVNGDLIKERRLISGDTVRVGNVDLGFEEE